MAFPFHAVPQAPHGSAPSEHRDRGLANVDTVHKRLLAIEAAEADFAERAKKLMHLDNAKDRHVALHSLLLIEKQDLKAQSKAVGQGAQILDAMADTASPIVRGGSNTAAAMLASQFIPQLAVWKARRHEIKQELAVLTAIINSEVGEQHL